jgi:hypothetical protein
VRAQDLLRSVRGRNHQRRDRAEAEQHEAPVTLLPRREVPQGDVREPTGDEVEVPDQRHRWRGRRHPLVFSVAIAPCGITGVAQQNEEYEREDQSQNSFHRRQAVG